VVDVTPAGRGQVISHALYEPEEMERLRARYHGGGDSRESDSEGPMASRSRPSVVAPSLEPTGGLAEELRSVRAELAELRRELESLSAIVRRGE